MPISGGLMALAGIGEGLREGVKTYSSFRDAREKKREKDAELGLMGSKQGMLYNADAGTFDKGPGYDATSSESVAARNRTRGLLNTIKAGMGDEAITDDWTEHDINDKQSHLNELIKARTAKDPMAAFEFRDEQQAKRLHDKLITRLDNNKPLQNQLSSLTNLRNATSLTEKAAEEGKPITKQQFADLQQTVIQNLGIKGVQAVHERDAKALGSLGINAEAAWQFLSGEPQDIGKNHPLYKHVQDMARWQSGNLANQYEDQIGQITSGHESMYAKYPRLQADLDAKIAKMTKSARGREYKGSGDSGSGIMPQKAPASTSGGGTSAPKAGDVIDGYRFKGGDPSNKASWEKK